MKKPVKAVGLISGGLDSTLAAKLLTEQGIEVFGLNLYTGFCITETKRRNGAYREGEYKPNEALKTGGDIEIPIEIIDIAAEGYFDVVKNPKYGRGSNLNPCIDCRIFMFRRAKQYMQELGADFVFTGEVLGQRPMSQHRQAMQIIERESGLQGLLLRPLSAKLLDPTLPELDGRVDRTKLLAFTGRGRRPQMELAGKLGLLDYAQPAGGCCYLTDENYARKFRDLYAHDPERDITKRDITLLAMGRHFRLRPEVKFVVGRNEAENRALETEQAGDTLLTTDPLPGPATLVQGPATAEELKLIAAATARYCDKKGESIAIRMLRGGAQEDVFQVTALSDEALDPLRI
jgi:tRNA U34 2-thiouridine synthase MnmA/TrmU